MTADRVVMVVAIAGAAFALGLGTRKAECPDKAQGETLVSITTANNVTTCTYGAGYGRSLTKRKAT